MGPGRRRRRRLPQGRSGVKLGAVCRTDHQVGINNGNRREDVFFTIRLGKNITSASFQQPIPTEFVDFALLGRYHFKLNLQEVTLENANG